MESITNGLSQGSFTTLNVLDPATNEFADILSLISSGGGGGGGGTVSSATAPLSIQNGVLSIDLSGYTSAAALAAAIAPLATTTGLKRHWRVIQTHLASSRYWQHIQTHMASSRYWRDNIHH